MTEQSAAPMTEDDLKHSGQAIIENGSLVIRVALSALPQVVEGSWATGNLRVRYKITNVDEFAAAPSPAPIGTDNMVRFCQGDPQPIPLSMIAHPAPVPPNPLITEAVKRAPRVAMEYDPSIADLITRLANALSLTPSPLAEENARLESLDAIISYYATNNYPRYTSREAPKVVWSDELSKAQSAAIDRHRHRHIAASKGDDT